MTTFSGISRQRAHEQVLAQLELKIATGELQQGDRLPSERSLMEQLGVSRPTVREALRVAESLGLVTVRPGDPGGPVVLARPAIGVSRAVDYLLKGDSANLVHLIELRMNLEGGAAYLCAMDGVTTSPALSSAVDAMRTAVNQDELRLADTRFHEIEGELSGNPFLAMMISALREPIARSIGVGLPSLGWPDARSIAVSRHGAVVDAIRAGDSHLARHLSRLHLFQTYGQIVSKQDRPRLEAVLEMDPAGTSTHDPLP